MAKNKPVSFRRFWVAISITATIAVIATALSATALVEQRRALDDPSTLRSLILTAVANLNRPVPSDAKTGDYYLREQRLVIPGQYTNIGLTYRYDSEDASYNLSSTELLSQSTAKLYQAQTVKTLMDAVPHLQSCQRGASVRLKSLQQPDDGVILVHTIALRDGRTAYIYAESECKTDLGPVLESLKTMQSY